ncbi:MAG: hypothetical protein Q9175_002436 [Cornicularia normoerica]
MCAMPQTPQRPLPGAYIQTPAHSLANKAGQLGQPTFRPNAITSQNGSQGQSQALTQQKQQTGQVAGISPAEELKPTGRAARTINETLDQESRYPELDSFVSQGPSSDYDIPSQPAWAPFQRAKSYSIPDSILAQSNNAKLSTIMGLFADLNHAWIAIDNSLYLWDYTQPDPELIGFEEQQQQITAVRLVTPRAGVFVSSITRMLVVATSNEIVLIGLASQDAPGGGKSVNLFSTRLSISIKGMTINLIEGSAASGRVFFSESTSDDVYELTYQQEEKWFQNRCAKINHTSKGVSAFNPGPILGFGQRTQQERLVDLTVDDTRNLLYTLSSQSTIRVFHMRPNNGLALMITKTLAATLNDIGHMPNLTTDLLSSNITIASVDAISSKEAVRLHLMATTSTGCRIFLSATSSGSYNAYNISAIKSSDAPTSMQVQHVKFPPIDPKASPARQQNARQLVPYGNNQGPNMNSRALNGTRRAVRYAPGYFFCFVPRDAQGTSDSLFISAPDAGRIARQRENTGMPKYPEFGMWPDLGSRAEDVGLASDPFCATTSPAGFGNELAVQYDEPVSEIAILTNTGVHTYRRRRLVDMLASALQVGGGDEGLDGEIKKFLRLYGAGETASTALAVACGQGLYVTSEFRIARVTDPKVLEYARKAFIEHGGKPYINENQVMDQPVPAIDTVRPSPRHAGLALYVARLVRSIWKATIVKESVSPMSGLMVFPTVSMAKVQSISQDLVALKEFLGANKNLIDGLAGPEALGLVSTKQAEITLQAEHRALHSLVVLIQNIIEGIAFVQVLFDEQIAEIMASLPAEIKQQVQNLTYEGLFCTANGKELAKELVKAVVNRNIANGSNVETVAEALRRRCGSFCSADDVIVFKAQELLKRSSETGGESESGRNLLNESLRLFKQVAGSLPMDRLQWAVESFITMQFYAGAIQLALDVAQESDRGNRALAWIQDGRPDQDQRAAAFESRKRCYNLIHHVITILDQASTQGPSMIDGQYTLAAKRRAEAYDVINTSNDEAFQTDLYDWYLSQERTDRLLDIQSPYIVIYLERKASGNITHADLLWKYHSQRGQNHEAAVVQLMLARSDFKLSLDRRIEYLGRAKANASTTSPGIARHARYQLLRDVSDLLDVANIQSDLLQRLKGDERIPADRRPAVINDLDGALVPFDVLYNGYADQAGYFDLCLLIYQAADHRNPADIRATWQNLLDRTHEEIMTRGTPQPYEVIIEKVQSLAKRLNLSETMFPIADIVPILEKYAFEFQNGVGPRTWPMDTLVGVGVPFESLFTVLEGMFYNDEAPFQGRNRRYIANDIIYVAGLWFQDSSRGVGKILGGEGNAAVITQTLMMLQQSGLLDENTLDECRALRARIELTLR